MKPLLLLSTLILVPHGLYVGLYWLWRNRQYLALSTETRWTLGLCLAVALGGLWLVWRARKPSRWDFPARTRAERQAAEKAYQKAHEFDNRRF